jgi:hypothetical protein
MKRLKKIKASVYSVFLITFIVTSVSWNLNWGDDHWVGIIKSDGKGYYSYLPSIFIYHDLNYDFFDYIEKEKYSYTGLFIDYRSTYKDKRINKFYCGTAVAMLPFFGIAHSLSCHLGCDVDGYSKTYQVLMNIAAIFYLLIGLLFLNGLLGLYNMKEWIKSFVLTTAVFGTNLFYYVIGEPAMSHVYSFAFVAMFMYYSKLYLNRWEPRHLYWMAFSFGMIVLIRPINGIAILLLPVLSDGWRPLKQAITELLRSKIAMAVSGLIFILVISIQLIIYKATTGDFFVYSYADEDFYFLCPYMSDFLFSYKKGMFLYTPVYLIAFTGCVYFYKRSLFSMLSWLLFFFVSLYIFSSWWCWYYGGSFSSRVYVEFIPAFMLMLAFALKGAKKIWVRATLVSIIVILILVCQIQTYQYRYVKIHWSDTTKEMYWEEFLRIDRLL